MKLYNPDKQYFPLIEVYIIGDQQRQQHPRINHNLVDRGHPLGHKHTRRPLHHPFPTARDPGCFTSDFWSSAGLVQVSSKPGKVSAQGTTQCKAACDSSANCISIVLCLDTRSNGLERDMGQYPY